ncbi:BspA family leucine-rich repeat surface protein [Aquimarina sp. Aq78]|uniref:BspA family leucine-rich repeat surface protein n=2 Tax=Aquimarina sp. Aq78 TaxID=1191889 RepID=UPI00131C3795|nr:BspA family leucine-rich repeat surface protein [Aquimarina sp. Aq78]
MMKRKQVKVNVLALSMIAILSIGCSKDDDVQPRAETPGETPTAEVNKVPEISAQTFTVAEDIADDTVIGKVAATDPESKALTFTLTKNSDALFELTDTGELSLVADKKLDFETVTSHTLTVEVSDGKHKVSADITLAVENVVEPFITTWKTTTVNERIAMFINGGFTYNYTIDWGDGTIEENKTGSPSHTYITAGTYTVAISGDFPAITLRETGSASKLVTIEQWGDNEWESFLEAFMFCENMTYNATDIPNLSKVTNMKYMFYGATLFNGDLSNWDVSNVTNMEGMFTIARSFSGDLSNWDVSNVTNMKDMFANTNSFNSDLSSWNVSKVTNMYAMFSRAGSFNSDLSNWDVSNVTNMYAMFWNATSFTGDVSNWEVSKVTNMEGMLSNTKLSTATYDALLTKWAALPNLQSNVTFGVEGLVYCDAYAARNMLINDKNWTLNGDKSCPR